MTEYETEKMRMLESDVERYKTSAGMWRNHAYKMSGTPLPWDADELLQKAIEAEREACARVCEAYIAAGIGKEMAAAIRARGYREKQDSTNV